MNVYFIIRNQYLQTKKHIRNMENLSLAMKRNPFSRFSVD